jgi:hypothetical protein
MKVQTSQKTLNHFWKRWRSEYLTELRESHRYLLQKSHGTPQVSVGARDVVIVHEERVIRSFQKIGRIQDLIIGRDGKTRGTTIRITDKNCRFTSLNWPLHATTALNSLVPRPIPPGKAGIACSLIGGRTTCACATLV